MNLPQNLSTYIKQKTIRINYFKPFLFEVERGSKKKSCPFGAAFSFSNTLLSTCFLFPVRGV